MSATTDRERLRLAWHRTGLTQAEFARTVLRAPTSSFTGWLGGARRIPGPVTQLARLLLAEPTRVLRHLDDHASGSR